MVASSKAPKGHVDNGDLRDYFLGVLVWGDVKRLRAILVLFLLGAAICAIALPRADQPETAFNEADAPVNLAPPVRATIRVTPPTVSPMVVLPTLRFRSAVGIDSSLSLESAAMPRQRHQHSLQDLLCTLLI